MNKKINYLLYLILFLSFFLKWFTVGDIRDTWALNNLNLLPKISLVFIDLLVIILFINIYKYVKKYLLYISLLILIYIIFDSVILVFNNGGLVNLILGIRNTFSGIAMFFSGMYLFRTNQNIKKFLLFLLVILLMQIPVAIFQFIYSGGNVLGGSFDFVSGTLGGEQTNILAAILSSAILLLITFYFHGNRKKLLLLPIPFFVLIMALSESKGALLYLFVIIMYSILFLNIGISKKITIMALVLSLVLTFTYIYKSEINNRNQAFLSLEFLIKYETLARDYNKPLSRIESIKNSFSTIFSNPISVIVGKGLGNATVNSTPFGEDGQYYSAFTIRNFFSIFIIETGLFGILVLTIIYKKIFNAIYIVSRRSSTYFNKTIANGAIGILLIVPVAAIHDDTIYRQPFTFPLALILGYLYSNYIEITHYNRCGIESD